MSIRALIFDFDGLILETEGPSYQSWEAVYRSFGLDLPFSTWSTIIGTTQGPFDPLQKLQSQVTQPVDWQTVETKRMAAEQALNEAQPILPGVLQYLEDARRLGLKLGVASSSSAGWVLGHLKRLGLVNYFDCIRTKDDVEHVKPYPELYHSVLCGLGIQADEAIALEDSPNGVHSAKSAGIYCVAVPNPLTKQLPLDQADLLLGSLAEMPLAQLLKKVNMG
ncbi:MAG TPA: HAD family hydrolase [Anaerolineales bacterium]|nr:HAD family hydrolase [Anaerolineales bacterium]